MTLGQGFAHIRVCHFAAKSLPCEIHYLDQVLHPYVNQPKTSLINMMPRNEIALRGSYNHDSENFEIN